MNAECGMGEGEGSQNSENRTVRWTLILKALFIERSEKQTAKQGKPVSCTQHTVTNRLAQSEILSEPFKNVEELH